MWIEGSSCAPAGLPASEARVARKIGNSLRIIIPSRRKRVVWVDRSPASCGPSKGGTTAAGSTLSFKAKEVQHNGRTPYHQGTYGSGWFRRRAYRNRGPHGGRQRNEIDEGRS